LVVYAVLVAATFGGMLAGWSWWQIHRTDGEDPLPATADRRHVSALNLTQVAAKARRLRPSLAATPTSLFRPGDAGITLGAHVTRGRLGLGGHSGSLGAGRAAKIGAKINYSLIGMSVRLIYVIPKPPEDRPAA
jgi:hypothetical protein